MDRAFICELRFIPSCGKHFLSGDFVKQADTASIVRKLLASADNERRKVVLDCSRVSHMDGHGVNALIGLCSEMSRRELPIEISGVDAKFKHKFEERGVGDNFPIPIRFAEGATNVGSSAAAAS